MALIIIAATGLNDEIGKGLEIPWRLPNDFKHFKATTTGSDIIMGRKTFDSLPGVLPNRRHIVITRDRKFKAQDGVEVVHSIYEALEVAFTENVFVIGGAEIYAEFLPYADTMIITRVNGTFEDADIFFPKFNDDDWVVGTIAEFKADEKHAYDYAICEINRKPVNDAQS